MLYICTSRSFGPILLISRKKIKAPAKMHLPKFIIRQIIQDIQQELEDEEE